MASSSGSVHGDVTWDIRRDGHAWGDEALSRYQMTPEKHEMIAGKL
jgi:hypothetical protein